MTEHKISKLWHRASDRWDRSQIPPAFDEGETWERIEQEGVHLGARRRTITHQDESLAIEEKLALAEGSYVGSWTSKLHLTAPPEPVWTSYEFTIGSSKPITFESAEEQSIPRFGLYPMIVGVPFEAGQLKPITVLDDRSGEAADESHLVSVGWDEAINGQWWRIDQYHDGERRAAYWLDAQHRLMRSDWEGAVLTTCASRAEALGELADQLGVIFTEEPTSDVNPE